MECGHRGNVLLTRWGVVLVEMSPMECSHPGNFLSGRCEGRREMSPMECGHPNFLLTK